MNAEALEVLRAAREQISDPANWCKGSFAKNYAGKSVQPWDPTACQWCLGGAIGAQDAKTNLMRAQAIWQDLLDLLRTAAGEDGFVSPAYFNDTHTHEEVLALMDRALEVE